MGDDVGWFNIGAYHRGIMSGKTPNLDKLASQGMMFTDYYAEASCTAGRANFITGENPAPHGLTTVGQAGADVGMPDQACTIATALKSQGYATGQFGKNHLGDLNKYLPTLHGFDEFFGYLYHLDAMSDPTGTRTRRTRPSATSTARATCSTAWATDTGRSDRDAALGQGRQAEDRGRRPAAAVPTCPCRNMQNVQGQVRHGDVRREFWSSPRLGFMDKAKKDGKPFFVWHNTTRMHVWTFLSQKYQAMMNSETNYGLEEAGMAQLDDIVGAIMKHCDDIGEADNTIVVFTTDNGAEVVHLAGRRQTRRSRARRARSMRAASACRASPAGRARSSRARSRTACSPASTGSPRSSPPPATRTSPTKLLKGVKLGDRTYKNHLDGYNQLDLLHGQGAVRTARVLLLRRPTAGRRSPRRLEVPVLPAAARLARAEGRDRHAHHREHPPGPVRADPTIAGETPERPGRSAT